VPASERAFEVDGTDVVLSVVVQPGATRTAVVGLHGDAVKVRVAAAPDRGRANAALVDLLASELDLRRANVAIVSGHGGRTKRVRLRGVSADRVAAWLAEP
jgi:uncharacterized protein (TIGR00251 family)